MRDPAGSLTALLLRSGGFAVIYYPDLSMRDWILEEAKSFTSREPAVVHSVRDALEQPDELVFLMPRDERQAVQELEATREQFLDDRPFPVVLFLLRDGDGQRALPEAPALASVLAGKESDPERLAEIDVPEERRQFERETGLSPEDWLARWRREEYPADSTHYSLAYRAALLEGA